MGQGPPPFNQQITDQIAQGLGLLGLASLAEAFRQGNALKPHHLAMAQGQGRDGLIAQLQEHTPGEQPGLQGGQTLLSSSEHQRP
jgi:hypothetical protein